MRIAIVGSRKYLYLKKIVKLVDNIKAEKPVIVSGGAPGPDSYAEMLANSRELPVDIYPVNRHGIKPNDRKEFAIRAKERNTSIVENSDIVVAFWDGKSKGTLDTINKAESAGKPVFIAYELGEIKLKNSQNIDFHWTSLITNGLRD